MVHDPMNIPETTFKLMDACAVPSWLLAKHW